MGKFWCFGDGVNGDFHLNKLFYVSRTHADQEEMIKIMQDPILQGGNTRNPNPSVDISICMIFSPKCI